MRVAIQVLAVVLCLAPMAALAQPSPKAADPMQQALGNTLSETLAAEVQWRARALAEGQEVQSLRRQLAEANKKASRSCGSAR